MCKGFPWAEVEIEKNFVAIDVVKTENWHYSFGDLEEA